MVISRVIIRVTPFRALITLLITYLLSPLPSSIAFTVAEEVPERRLEVQGFSGFRGLGFRGSGVSGFRILDFGVWVLRLRAYTLETEAHQGLGVPVEGLTFRVEGLGFRVEWFQG